MEMCLVFSYARAHSIHQCSLFVVDVEEEDDDEELSELAVVMAAI